jgi:hypothetical protein
MAWLVARTQRTQTYKDAHANTYAVKERTHTDMHVHTHRQTPLPPPYLQPGTAERVGDAGTLLGGDAQERIHQCAC